MFRECLHKTPRRLETLYPAAIPTRDALHSPVHDIP